MKRLVAALLVAGLAGCATAPKPSSSVASALPERAVARAQSLPERCNGSPYAPAQEDPSTRGDYVAGGLYKPGVADTTPSYVPDVECIPEPLVVDLPRSRVGNRATYAVLGKQYRVLDDQRGYVEQGLASYYGNKFHGRRTSNMEVYDMYAFSAAHKSLPLPSFARVTNLDNGKSVTVRVNDRGPFHEGRVIDLSYAAAVKLGIVQRGTGRVEVRALVPDQAAPMLAAAAGTAGNAGNPVAAAASASAGAAVPVSLSSPTAMDTLVAAMPLAAAAGAVVPVAAAAAETSGSAPADVATPGRVPDLLPPGVRIATGKPTRLSGDDDAPPASAAASEALSGRPASAASAAPAQAPVDAQPAATTAPTEYRFDMHQDGKAMSAEEFEGWMKQRKVQVATGRAVRLATPSGALPAATAAAPASSARAAAAVTTARQAAAEPGGVTLQVASFAARGNADRALAMLRGAGIEQVQLLEAQANGKQVWRLRVGPLAASTATRLATRIAGLGFGPPRLVRD